MVSVLTFSYDGECVDFFHHVMKELTFHNVVKALILLCEEVIESTASAVTCVKNDRICDIIFQLYPSALCQIIHLTKTDNSGGLPPRTEHYTGN